MSRYVGVLIAFSLIAASISYNIASYPLVWAMLEGGRAQLEQMAETRDSASPNPAPLSEFSLPPLPEAVPAPVMPKTLAQPELPVKATEPESYEAPARPYRKSVPGPLERLGE